MKLPKSNSLQEIRAAIRAALREELGHDVLLSERAAIVFEHFFYDKHYTSWQLKMLNTIFQTTPATYSQIINFVPTFSKFNYAKLSRRITGFEGRSPSNAVTDFREIIRQLFSEPDPGRIAVLRMGDGTPKKHIVKNVVTIDALVLLLFWELYLGEYVSDLAVGMLALARRKLHFGKLNRWYLDSFEGLSTDTEAIDHSYSDQQWVLFNDENKVRIRPFGAWGVNQLQESPLPDGSLWVARGNVLQRPGRFSEEKLEELEHLINKNGLESDFQRFFERNPEFLLALGNYKHIHSQLVLHEDNGDKLIPDFFLEKVNSDFCDILDLKRAHVQLSRSQKSRNRFSDAVHEVVAQLDHYRNWFEDRQHRQMFKSKYGLQAYRPRMVAIVGRKENAFDEMQRIQVVGQLPKDLELRTYDDIVSSARHYLSLFRS